MFGWQPLLGAQVPYQKLQMVPLSCTYNQQHLQVGVLASDSTGGILVRLLGPAKRVQSIRANLLCSVCHRNRAACFCWNELPAFAKVTAALQQLDFSSALVSFVKLICPSAAVVRYQ